MRKATGDTRYQSEGEIELASTPLGQAVRESLWRPFQLCFTEPILLSTNLYLGLVYAILYCWFEAFPLVFADIYDFDLGQSGLAFLGLLVGAVVAMVPYIVCSHKAITNRS